MYILEFCWFCKNFSTISFHCHRWFLDLVLSNYLCCWTRANASCPLHSLNDRLTPQLFPRSRMLNHKRLWVSRWWNCGKFGHTLTYNSLLKLITFNITKSALQGPEKVTGLRRYFFSGTTSKPTFEEQASFQAFLKAWNTKKWIRSIQSNSRKI